MTTDDAIIRKWANRVWWWVDDETNIARVDVDDYVTSMFYSVPPEMTLYDPQPPVSEYHSLLGNEAQWQAYRFFPLDGPAIVLRLAFAREINTVFVKEEAEP